MSTYLSEVTRRYTHQTAVIGLIVGSEGIMALWIPLIAGAWSDCLRTRLGGRLPFVIAGAVPAAVAVVLIGLVHSLALVATMAALFFAFYFVAYEPYRAMYPDLGVARPLPFLTAGVVLLGAVGGFVWLVIRRGLARSREPGEGPRAVARRLPRLLRRHPAPVFTSTDGFQAMWLVCAAAALCSLLFLHRLRDADQDRRQLREEH